MNDDHLDSELWLIELSEIVEECDTIERLGVGALLRKVHTLLSIAPKEWSPLFEPLPDKRAFTAMLVCEAFESAAIRLLGSKTGYMLSRSTDGYSLASIWIQTNRDEVHARADSAAVALIKAFTMAVFFSLGQTVNLGDKPSLESF